MNYVWLNCCTWPYFKVDSLKMIYGQFRSTVRIIFWVFFSQFYSYRLWIKLRKRSIRRHGSCEYQELNYTDLVPEIDEKGAFAKLHDLIEQANILIRKEEIQGRIISVETVTYEANTDWKIDPDATLSALSTKKLFILRIFYEEGLPLQEEIGKYIMRILFEEEIKLI